MLDIIYFNDSRYVKSRDLHRVLQLKDTNYSRDVKAWFETEYLFQGKKELTFPTKDYDYFHSSLTKSESLRGRFADDYLIRLELAKLITLETRSPLKKQFVQWLLSLEQQVEDHQLLSRDLVLGLLEMAKLCSYIDNQLLYYKEHKDCVNDAIDHSDYKYFDNWRNKVLEIEYFQDVKYRYHISSFVGNLQTKTERLAFLDGLKSIRNAMFDLLKVTMYKVDPLFPKSTEKALDLSNFTKKMFEVAGLKPDIKRKNYKRGDQAEMFRDIESINYRLIDNAIKNLCNNIN